MNFRQMRIQRDTPKEITLPECQMALWVKPVSIFDLAVSGDIPPAFIQDLSDLDQQAITQAKAQAEGNASIKDLMDNAVKSAEYGRKLIKQLVIEEPDTPDSESWRNDDNLNMIPVKDLVWLRQVAMAGFTDESMRPEPTEESLIANADFPESEAE